MEHYHLHEGRIHYRTVVLNCISLALMHIITPSEITADFFLKRLMMTTVYIISQISFLYIHVLIF